MKSSANYIITSAWTCIFVCIGEFVTIFVFGTFDPGYSQIRDTMSKLGTSGSPVSVEISLWWILMGLLMIFFATGFRMAFNSYSRYTRLASWLIILYGVGEGIGSGLFKADRVMNKLTTTGDFHQLLGIIGVSAILLLPLVALKVFPKNKLPRFYRFSQIIFICGIVTILLFLTRYTAPDKSFLSLHKGLWQRLFMLNTYIYLSAISVHMIRSQKDDVKR